jgi:hypothetical protein
MTRKLIGAICLILVSGCSLMVDPFKDEYANRPPVTTPSVDSALAANVPASEQERIGEEKVRYAADGGVVHLPLYFEEPFEESGSENGTFAWTGEDYVWIAYSRLRFMANLFAFPVSAVVYPPWQETVSDGRLSHCGRGHEFDAEPRCRHDEP